jgi:hypothetical protein
MNKTFNHLVDYIVEQLDLLERRPELYRYISDGIRNNIFYMASTNEFFTGKYSYSAYKLLADWGNGRKSELCKEHHYSLKKLCNEIMDSSVRLDKGTIVNMIKEKATWNYTTKEENLLLKSNNQSYKNCGIILNTLSEWEETQYSKGILKGKSIDTIRKVKLIDVELVKRNELLWDKFTN